MLVAWTGVISALNLGNKAQAITARRLEMTRAIDLMANEIRQAQAINRSGTTVANGSTVSLADVVQQGGVTLNQLGPYGEISLYLEIPFTQNAPEICPSGTDYGNSSPAGPSGYDPVVYDVRDSPMGWLPPKVVTRYGRIPQSNGTLDPCSRPVANDIVADSLAATNSNATCPNGVLAGQGGFQTCTQGETVELLFKSSIDGVKTVDSDTTITQRSQNFSPTSSSSTSGRTCQTESFQYSENDDTPVDLTFVNQRDSAVHLYWLNYIGNRESFGEIQPGQSLIINTFVTHPWVVADNTTAQCTDLVMPDLNETTINIA